MSENVPRPSYDVIVPGHYFCDLIFTGLPSFPALGAEIYTGGLDVAVGGVLNTVVALRRLEMDVGWAGAVGEDFFSHYILHKVDDEGIDTALVEYSAKPLQRVTVSLSSPEDRAFVTHIDRSPRTVDLAIGALERADCRLLHFSGLAVDSRVPDLIRRCHDRGIVVSMDCQHREQTTELPLVCEILSLVDIFMPNACEAKRLTDAQDVQGAIDALAEDISHIVVKNGANGAIAWWDGELIEEPALALDSIYDTTGAGDVFNAGFLASYLDGCDVRTCLRWGNYCGGMSTQAAGGATAAPTRAQLLAWINRK
jgi:sugar/nucleoside kinase (ribokinase family)